ncbi:MAG: hypothetical protein ACYSW3_26010, partial [Planctomycetota bacterium]
MTNPFIAALLAQQGQQDEEEQQDTVGFKPEVDPDTTQDTTIGFKPEEPEAVVSPAVETPELAPINERLLQQVDDQAEIEARKQQQDLIRMFGQAQLTFAPDITGRATSTGTRSLIEVIGDNAPGALPL